MSELPSHLRARRGPRGLALRLLRIERARPARAGEGRAPAGISAAAQRSRQQMEEELRELRRDRYSRLNARNECGFTATWTTVLPASGERKRPWPSGTVSPERTTPVSRSRNVFAPERTIETSADSSRKDSTIRVLLSYRNRATWAGPSMRASMPCIAVRRI
jgi:hypothetical protein